MTKKVAKQPKERIYGWFVVGEPFGFRQRAYTMEDTKVNLIGQIDITLPTPPKQLSNPKIIHNAYGKGTKDRLYVG